MRIVLAGVIGAIVMFVWATIAHTVTPLASIGLKGLPAEAATIATLRQSLGEKPGTYFFPYAAPGDSKSMAAQMEKLKTNPSGLLVYQPPGTPGLTTRQLGVEFALELVESLLAAAALAMAAGLGPRIGMAVMVGLIAGISTNLSYWNWYGFDLSYSLANAFTELMKFVFAGIAIALVLGRERKATAGG